MISKGKSIFEIEIIETDWESVDETLERLKVPGGWLVRTYMNNNGVSITFYPDPKHKWK